MKTVTQTCDVTEAVLSDRCLTTGNKQITEEPNIFSTKSPSIVLSIYAFCLVPVFSEKFGAQSRLSSTGSVSNLVKAGPRGAECPQPICPCPGPGTIEPRRRRRIINLLFIIFTLAARGLSFAFHRSSGHSQGQSRDRKR